MFKIFKISVSATKYSSAASLTQSWNEFAKIIGNFHSNRVKIGNFNTNDPALQAAFNPIASQVNIIPLLLDRKSPSSTVIYTCYAIFYLHLQRRNVEKAFNVFKQLTEYLYTSDLLIIPHGNQTEHCYTEENSLSNLMLDPSTLLVNSTKMKKSWLRKYEISLPEEHFHALSQIRSFQDHLPPRLHFDYHILSILILLTRVGDHRRYYMEMKQKRIQDHISRLMDSKLSQSELSVLTNTVLHFYTFRGPLYAEIRKFKADLLEKFGYTFNLANYTVLMQAALRSGRLEMVQGYYEGLIAAGFEPDKNIHSIMVRMYCLTHRPKKALEFVLGLEKCTRKTWNELLNVIPSVTQGYAKSNKPIQDFLKIYQMMLSRGYKEDIGLLTIMLQAYANRNLLEKVVEVFDKILHAGFTPDKYIYGILQKVALRNPESLSFTYWFENAFSTTLKSTPNNFFQRSLNPYDSVHSMTELFRHYAATGDVDSVYHKDFLEIFQNQPILLSDPLPGKIAFKKYLTTPGGRKKAPELLQYLIEKNVPDFKSFLPLAIASQAREESNDVMIAWDMLESNMDEELVSGDIIINLYLSSTKANDTSKLDAIFEMYKSLKIPMHLSNLHEIISILCFSKRGGLTTFEKVRKSLLRNPLYLMEKYFFIGDRELDRKSDPVNPILELRKTGALISDIPLQYSYRKGFFLHAVKFVNYHLFTLNRKINDASFQCLCDEAMNAIDPENTVIQVYQILHKINKKDNRIYHNTLYKLFFMRLFHSQNWRIVFFFLNPYWRDPNSIEFKYFLEYIKEESDKDILLVLWQQVRQKYPLKEVLIALLEKLSIDFKCVEDSRTIFESIPRSWMKEEIHWVYVRGLVWNSRFDETIWMCTGGYDPKPSDTGLVVIQMCRYLRSLGLSAEEQQLRNYWQSSKPDWIERI